MKTTLAEAFEMIGRGETPEQYESRIRKLKKYTNERDFLMDALEVLTAPGDADRRAKKEKRLKIVLERIEKLQ